MGDQDEAAGDRLDFLANQPPDVGGVRGVDAACGFVHQQDARLLEQGARNGEALLHPGGELSEGALGAGLQVEPLEKEGYPRRRLLWADAFEAREELEVLPRGEPPVEASVVGEDVPDVSTHSVAILRHVSAEHGDSARVWKQQGGDGLEHRRLADTVGAQQGHIVALAHFEVDSPQDGVGGAGFPPQEHLHARPTELLVDSTRLDHLLSHARPLRNR